MNYFSQQLLQKISQPIFDYKEFLSTQIEPNATNIDTDPILLSQHLRTLAVQIFSPISELYQINLKHIEMLFGRSGALAFTLMQHLAAIERLADAAEWQLKQAELWSLLNSGETLCGLCTTHLASPSGAGVRGVQTEHGYLLNGKAPWMCGYGIFDVFVVGFEVDDSIAFATTIFPKPTEASKIQSLSFKRQKMVCLNGSSTVETQFKNHFVPNNSIVSKRIKVPQPPQPRPTKYLIPELGIGKFAVEKIKQIISQSNHPRNRFIEQNLQTLQKRIEYIDKLRANKAPTHQLFAYRDDLNRDAVRLLALISGARAIEKENPVGRMQLELMVFDAILQSPLAFEMKVSSTTSGSLEY